MFLQINLSFKKYIFVENVSDLSDIRMASLKPVVIIIVPGVQLCFSDTTSWKYLQMTQTVSLPKNKAIFDNFLLNFISQILHVFVKINWNQETN